VRACGRGILVVAGGRAVMSMIGGDGDADVCGDDDEGVMGIGVACRSCDRLLDVNGGWGVRSVSKSSNGHQSNVVSRAPGVFS